MNRSIAWGGWPLWAALALSPTLATAQAQPQQVQQPQTEAMDSAAMRDVQLEWSKSPRPPLGPGSAQEPPSAVDESAEGGGRQQWTILMRDKSLYRVLSRWALQANYQLNWQVDRDYPIESEVVFEGGFRGAVSEVMSVVALTDYPLQAVFNPGARTLRVVRFLDEARR